MTKCLTYLLTQIAKYVIKFADDGPPMYATNVRKLLRRTMTNGERCQPPAHIEIEVSSAPADSFRCLSLFGMFCGKPTCLGTIAQLKLESKKIHIDAV